MIAILFVTHYFLLTEHTTYLPLIIYQVYFAAEFDKLRSLLMPGEALHDFIHSLSYCNKWRAKGGKSGLAFSKTQDDRWVVKEMSRLELQALLMFMPNYVEYVIDSIDKRPTLLAKIVGACTVGFSNTHTGISMRQDVIIMENILYNVTPTVVYDLKVCACVCFSVQVYL